MNNTSFSFSKNPHNSFGEAKPTKTRYGGNSGVTPHAAQLESRAFNRGYKAYLSVTSGLRIKRRGFDG
jgi:hypothetical protein